MVVFRAAGAREAKCSHAFNEAGAKQLANDDDDSGKRLLSTISHKLLVTGRRMLRTIVHRARDWNDLSCLCGLFLFAELE